MNKKYLLAYTAGIIDGEGCILIARGIKLKSKVAYHQLQVVVSSTNLWLCEWLRMQYGGSITRDDKRYLRKSSLSKNIIYKWFLSSAPAAEFLEKILPYLYLKKSQAELAIKFQGKRISKCKLTSEEQLLREADYIRMRELKKLELKI